MIRHLARKSATFTEFADWVLIEAQFRRGAFEAGTEILKSHSAMTLLRAAEPDAELLIKLIRPRTSVKAAIGSRVLATEKIWRVFTASEVEEFAASVGDKNPIHRLNPPIVPGLLILEALGAEPVKLKFKNFVTAGEPLSLKISGERLEISSAGVRKVTGEFL